MAEEKNQETPKKPVLKKRQIVFAFVFAFIFALAVFLLFFFLTKDYSLRGWCNALFVPGAVLLFIPVFIWIRRSGVFDVTEYAFFRLFESFNPQAEGKRYKDASDYSSAQKEKREKNKPFLWPFFSVSGLLLLASFILVILENSLNK
jgi:hypothetical protein